MNDDKHFKFGGLLDAAAENKYTFDFSVMKPAFQIGQEVEVYYYRTRRWHWARVRTVRLDFALYVNSKESWARAWRWDYACDVLDTSISVTELCGYQTDGGPEHQGIRALEGGAS